jgi:signal transduction histidine kinase
VSPRPAPRLNARDSVLYKVVGALVVTLVVSGVVTAVIASRLTSNALNDQARRTAKSQLTVLQETFAGRASNLSSSMRNVAETLAANNLAVPENRAELIQELGRTSASYGLDLLQVVDAEGRELVQPAEVGTTLESMSLGDALEYRPESGSRLLAAGGGRFVQAVVVPFGGPMKLKLVAAKGFDDAFAYDLRRQIGGFDQVVLVADGRVAGSSLLTTVEKPPGQNGTRLPQSPKVVDVGGQPRLVAYAPLMTAETDPVSGALGVVLTNPISPLQKSLSNARLLTSVLLTLVALGLGWALFRVLIRPLQTLAATAGRVAGGDPEATFVRQGKDEIALLARSLEHMRLELRSKLELIARQAADLQESSQRIVAAQDCERQRLARDLHDGIQQQLVVLRMQAGMLEAGMGNGAGNGAAGTGHAADPTPPAEAQAQAFEAFGAELDQVIQQLREVTQDLYPSILIDRGLVAALHSYVGRLPVSAGLTCLPDDLPRLPPEIESGAYFLVGEAVTNALKHAEASRIDIGLAVNDDWLEVTVRDDGLGFLAGEGSHRGGLLHMEDRARSFGGELAITSAPGKGTTVFATFPLPTEAEAEAEVETADEPAAAVGPPSG